MKKKQFWIPVLITVLALGICVGFWWVSTDDQYRVWVALNADSEMTLEYGQDYTDPGATAAAKREFLGFRTKKLPVECSGQVDTNQLGTYILEYRAEYKGCSAVAQRVVRVVDTQKPHISLVGGSDVQFLPGEAYTEPGFTATDGCDGDISDLVEIVWNGDTATYSVTDASGNTASAVRTVRFVDSEPPVVSLLGDSYIELMAGGFYVEPGFAANDNCDGDITDKVIVDQQPDVFTPGEYTLCYSVTDAFGNETVTERTVRVVEPDEYTVAPYNGKDVYLTFDDGPSDYTEKLLDVLDKYDIKATFFVMDTAYCEILTRMAQSGHSIGAHTATHNYNRIYSSETAYFRDLERIQSVIETYTGERTSLLRFPGGSSNTVSRGVNRGIMSRLVEAVTEQGYVYFDWNLDSRDTGGARNAKQVYNNVVAGLPRRDSTIVLQHDIKGFSVEAVEDIIRWGLKNGYRFLPLTQDSPVWHHTLNN